MTDVPLILKLLQIAHLPEAAAGVGYKGRQAGNDPIIQGNNKGDQEAKSTVQPPPTSSQLLAVSHLTPQHSPKEQQSLLKLGADKEDPW